MASAQSTTEAGLSPQALVVLASAGRYRRQRPYWSTTTQGQGEGSNKRKDRRSKPRYGADISRHRLEAQRKPFLIWAVLVALWQMYGAAMEPL
jgi:hypothetical protein